MFRSFVKTIAVCVFLLLSLSCGGGRTGSASPEGGDTLALRHATHLRLVDYPRYTLAVVRNPWDTLQVLHTYVLLPDSVEVADGELPEGTVVRTPLKRSVVYTSVHCSLLDELGAAQAIAGVCDAQYIHRPIIHEGIRQGNVRDLGSGMAPDVEQIIDLHPDALLLSPFENSGGYGRVDRLGVPIIECADYMEASALGRAEWVRFYGRLYGRARQADSLFAAVERDYLMWRQRALACPERPTVLTDLPASPSAWYVPGGGSTIGGMYADAGACYLFADNGHSGSVPYSFETVYEKGRQADYWLIRYHAPRTKDYASLASEFEPYTHFSAFKNRRMYGCNTSSSTFYEDVPFHPERLLAEFACIFHPELGIDSLSSARYYLPLE